MSERYAIYLTPAEETPLERFARSWLGRSAFGGEVDERIEVPGIAPDEFDRLTASPRRYGFHATMKAPFRLANERTEADLFAAAETFAASRRRFQAPPLTVRPLSGFIAFVLSEPSSEMDELAADCVRDFEPFRAALTDDEVQRRRQSDLSDRQDAQMLAWGYPYVFEDFRFHMTLTQRLCEPRLSQLLSFLQRTAEPLCREPFLVDGIAIYHQPTPDETFTVMARLPFRS
ncbi:MAG: DUF1045 domain-containing protein [Geminicoccaceae bacterium]